MPGSRNSSGVQVAGAGWPLATNIEPSDWYFPCMALPGVSAFQTASGHHRGRPNGPGRVGSGPTRNNGAGSLSQPGPLVLADSLRPHIAATLVPQSLDYWVIVADHLLRRILAFRTGPGGTDTIPVVSATGVLESTLGYSDNMVLNAQGTMMPRDPWTRTGSTCSASTRSMAQPRCSQSSWMSSEQVGWNSRRMASSFTPFVFPPSTKWNMFSGTFPATTPNDLRFRERGACGTGARGMLVPWPRLGPDGCIHVPVAFEHHYTSILMPDLAGLPVRWYLPTSTCLALGWTDAPPTNASATTTANWT